MKSILLAAIMAFGGALLAAGDVRAAEHTMLGPHSVGYQHRKQSQAAKARADRNGPGWACEYNNVQFGSPVALVVPPTAEKYREMGWGVGNVRMHTIVPQFSRAYPGTMVDGSPSQYRSTPAWPSDTTQFGIYYVRGPW